MPLFNTAQSLNFSQRHVGALLTAPLAYVYQRRMNITEP